VPPPQKCLNKKNKKVAKYRKWERNNKKKILETKI
jgi:hypothetical protein